MITDVPTTIPVVANDNVINVDFTLVDVLFFETEQGLYCPQFEFANDNVKP